MLRPRPAGGFELELSQTMKPAFALSLSFEGICLLHRADGGWQRVGEVDPASATLPDDLAALRARALRLAPRLLCKLVLPNDQIRYLTVETGPFEGDALKHIIEGALDSATPYDVSELVYDTVAVGEDTHVAAVTRTTLTEAEGFAKEHGFLPVSFVARPDDGAFPGEPFFGASELAHGWTGSEAVEPDSATLFEIGAAPIPVAAPDPAPEDEADAPDEGGTVAPPAPIPVFEPSVDEPARHDRDASPPPAADTDGRSPRRARVVVAVVLLALLALAAIWVALKSGGDVASDTSELVEPAVLADTTPTPVSQPEPEPETVAERPVAEIEQSQDIATADQPVPSDLIAALPAPVEVPARTEPDAPAESEPEPEPEPEQDAEPDLPLPSAHAVLSVETTSAPDTMQLDDLYIVSIDRTDLSQDPVALPPTAQFDTDLPVSVQKTSAVAGSAFDLDDRGLVKPTAQGTRSPDGILVYLGRPSKVPPTTPLRFDDRPVVDEAREALAGKRPRPRPANLIELNERARLGGRSLAELATVRPKLRPSRPEPAAPAPPTKLAIAQSPHPKLRPAQLASQAQNAARLGSLASLDRETPVTSVAPKAVKPKNPSPASVARQATVKNAINLRKINLIGVFGTQSNRRALVRLANGRYKKVKIGDRIDGGRVVAIGDNELHYQKSGRNVRLKMPKG